MKGRMMFTMFLGTVLLIGFLSLPMNGAGQAEAPEWEVGDEWSMGYETDLGEMISPILGVLELLEGDEFGSIDHDIEGKAGYFMVFKVVEATGTQYTMDIGTGGGVDIDGYVKMTMDMPKEGEYRYSYDEWDAEPPMESKEISIDLVLGLSMKVDGTAHFTTDGLKLQDLEMVASLKGSFDLEMVNFPETNYDYDYETDEEVMTVEYTDYDLSGSADIELALNMEFDPPLDIFNFPIEENEEWMAESNVTASGTYQGTVDAEGIPTELMTDMLEDSFVFPIVLEELDTGVEEFNDGIISEFEFPLSIPVSCTGTETVKLADGSSAEAYVIQFGEEEEYDYYDDYYYEDDYMIYEEEEFFGSDLFSDLPEMKFLYCPDEGFFVSATMGGIGGDLGLGGMIDPIDSVGLEPMKTSDAEKKMDVFQGAGASDDDEGPGIFLWGLIAAAIFVVLAVIALVITVFIIKLKKAES